MLSLLWGGPILPEPDLGSHCGRLIGSRVNSLFSLFVDNEAVKLSLGGYLLQFLVGGFLLSRVKVWDFYLPVYICDPRGLSSRVPRRGAICISGYDVPEMFHHGSSEDLELSPLLLILRFGGLVLTLKRAKVLTEFFVSPHLLSAQLKGKDLFSGHPLTLGDLHFDLWPLWLLNQQGYHVRLDGCLCRISLNWYRSILSLIFRGWWGWDLLLLLNLDVDIMNVRGCLCHLNLLCVLFNW